MPTSNLTVGNQQLPLETGGTDSPVYDPRAVGFLDYFGFWIRNALSAKLGEMRGPVDSQAFTDACPAPYRFPWNHNGTFMRPHPLAGTDTMAVPLPGLWCWHERTVPSARYTTQLYRAYEHTLQLEYIFPPLSIPDGYNARSGLMTAVGNALVAACDRGRHPDYGYGTDPAGTGITASLGIMDFDFVSGQVGMQEPVPTTGKNGKGRGGASGQVLQFYPSYRMTFTVTDRVSDWITDPIADATPDILVAIQEHEVDLLERVLIAPEDTV